jgi:hypothetical protein
MDRPALFAGLFGRLDERGNVLVLHVEDGAPVTRLDASVYPVLYIVDKDGVRERTADLSARYEYPNGIVLSRDDADHLGIEIESYPPLRRTRWPRH